MSELVAKPGTHMTRLPFNSGDRVTRYCIEGLMAADPEEGGTFSVPTPNDPTAPGYCVDCMGELGVAELVYGTGAQKCMQCGSVFLVHGAE